MKKLSRRLFEISKDMGRKKKKIPTKRFGLVTFFISSVTYLYIKFSENILMHSAYFNIHPHGSNLAKNKTIKNNNHKTY